MIETKNMCYVGKLEDINETSKDLEKFPHNSFHLIPIEIKTDRKRVFILPENKNDKIEILKVPEGATNFVSYPFEKQNTFNYNKKEYIIFSERGD